MPTSIRVLCLHGMGDNAAIFRAQTAALRELLPNRYDFIFIEGEELCDPIPGIDQISPGPYRCWYSTPSTRKVLHAHQQVKKAIDEQGPFDIVIGFSQGASLAASLILHHQIDYPSSPPLFQAAIFFSAPLPFSAGLKHGIDSRTYFDIPKPKPLISSRPTAIPRYLMPSDSYYMRSDNDDSFYQMFHYTVDELRISIPTAHVFGRRDALWRRHSMDLIELCGGRKAAGTYVFEHNGMHEIPRDDAEDICDVFEMTVAKAGLI